MTDDKHPTCPVVASSVASELERRDRAAQARRDAEMAELAQLRADRDALRPLVEAVSVGDARDADRDGVTARLALADAVMGQVGRSKND